VPDQVSTVGEVLNSEPTSLSSVNVLQRAMAPRPMTLTSIVQRDDIEHGIVIGAIGPRLAQDAPRALHLDILRARVGIRQSWSIPPRLTIWSKSASANSPARLIVRTHARLSGANERAPHRLCDTDLMILSGAASTE
jgi:hypothetical protein